MYPPCAVSINNDFSTPLTFLVIIIITTKFIISPIQYMGDQLNIKLNLSWGWKAIIKL